MARRRTKVDKLIDDLEAILNDVYFHPTLMANMITTSYPPYTQQKLIELIKTIEKYHQKEMALEQMTGTGPYGDTIPPKTKSDTSWVHERQYAQPARIYPYDSGGF